MKPHPWEKMWQTGRWKEVSPPLPAVVEFCEHLKRAGATNVLDLGAGGGRHTLLLAQRGFQVVALDVSKTALQVLDRRVRRMGLSNVVAVLHEMQDLPFADNYFDAVVSTNVIQHGRREEILRTLGEVHRVLRAGGSGLLVVLSDKDYRMGTGKRIEPGTYVFTEGEEKGITHHFFARVDLRACLRGFRITSLREELLPVEGGNRAHFCVTLTKP